MNKKRIVITGIGIVSPIGIGKEAFVESLKAENPALRKSRSLT